MESGVESREGEEGERREESLGEGMGEGAGKRWGRAGVMSSMGGGLWRMRDWVSARRPWRGVKLRNSCSSSKKKNAIYINRHTSTVKY